MGSSVSESATLMASSIVAEGEPRGASGATSVLASRKAQAGSTHGDVSSASHVMLRLAIVIRSCICYDQSTIVDEVTLMQVLEAIRTKRSTRQFEAQPVGDDVIRAILNAGRHAQSSKNSQPWQFVVVRERQTLQRLSEVGPFAKHLAGAAFAIALISPPVAERWSIPFDLGQAAAYLQLAAWDRGVGSCIGAIYDESKARAILQIPADLDFKLALSFGYPQADVTEGPPRRGGRKALDELTHWEHW